jgi:D-alanyl-D-alanine endopeptidase (penicillin-binding protein 7)
MRSILLFVLAAFLSFHTAAAAISAKAYIVLDEEGNVVLEKNADTVQPIASITKLFVVQQAIKLDLDELIQVTANDVARGRMRSSPLRAGSSYSRKELIELALVSSDNVAALALARSSPPSTNYANLVEGSGLDPRNKSSARNIADAARELYVTEIGAFSIIPKTHLGGRNSTNPLLNKHGWEFLLSKTGFINSAGGCLTAVLKIKDTVMIVTILGSSGVRQRWLDLVELRTALGDSDFYIPSFTEKKRAVKPTKTANRSSKVTRKKRVKSFTKRN